LCTVSFFEVSLLENLDFRYSHGDVCVGTVRIETLEGLLFFLTFFLVVYIRTTIRV
jgi:hypothetical protein